MDSSRSSFLSRVVESLNRRNSITASTASLRSLKGKQSSLNSIVSSKDPKFSKVGQLVGREKELKQLMVCFDRMMMHQKSELVVIHGTSGSGKSSVVQAFTQNLPSEAFCVQGKFDQLQSHAPYSALVAASDQLCRQILKQPNSADIRNRIRTFLGPEMYLLGTLIPALAEVTKDESKDCDADYIRLTGEGGMSKSFIRFKLLFRAFLRSVASKENPLLFFLDDLQWADIASLEVLKSIVTDSLAQNIMILCAYREGEMSTDILRQHRLADDDVGNTMVDRSMSSSSGASGYCARITDILIECLNTKQLNELLSFKLEMDHSSTESLSQIIWNKTNGNPFYALNFLEMLYRESLLSISSDDEWAWDESQILRNTDVSDNLASILESKVQSLSEQVRSILQMASFIGHEFPLSVLVTIVHEEQDIIASDYSFHRRSKQVIREQIMSALKVAVEEGLLEKTDKDDDYKFAHDKIQEVLYETLMPDETERQLLHQRIGTLIWDSVRDVEKSQIDDWFIFLAADNLNRALNMVDYSGDRYYLIELNLTAAKRTIQKSALLLAAEYLRIAVNLVSKNEICWSERYELCLDVFNTAAEAEKNIGCHTRCANLIAVIHENAKVLHHRCTAFAIEMDSMTVQGHLEESVLLGLTVLRKLGIKFPHKIGTLILVKELLAAKAQLGRRKLRDLISLPEVKDEKLLFSFLILNAVAFNAFLLGDNYKEAYATICVRMFRLTLKYGISKMFSPIAIVSWVNLNVFLGRFDDAMDAEKLALDLVDKFGMDSVRGTVISICYGSCHFWREKLDSESRHQLLHGYQMAINYGDIHLAQFGVVGWVVAAIYLDDKLSDVHPKTRSVVSEMRELDCKSGLMFLLPNWQVLLNLSGDIENHNPSRLRGEALDDDFVCSLEDINSKIALGIFNLTESIVSYVFDDDSFAQRNLAYLTKNEKELQGFFARAFGIMWLSLFHYERFLVTGKRSHRRFGRIFHRKVDHWVTAGTKMLYGPKTFLDAMANLCLPKISNDNVTLSFQDAADACGTGRCRLLQALAYERLAKIMFVQNKAGINHQFYQNRAVEIENGERSQKQIILRINLRERKFRKT